MLKFIPLALMSTVGLFFITAGNFTPWNTSGDTDLSARSAARWRSASSATSASRPPSVAAAKVRDPARNVGRSTIYGTLASGVVYLLSLVAVFGILPASALALDGNKASYSAAADAIVGSGSWAGNLVALAVIVSGIGALNGWTMICAEMPLAAAKDGLFPHRFGGAVAAAGCPRSASSPRPRWPRVAVVISYLGTSGATVFTTLVLMTGITAAIPYAFSALAQIRLALARPPGRPDPALRPRPRVAVVAAGDVGGVHLLLPQHRQTPGTSCGARS